MSSRLRLGFDPEFAPLTYVESGRPAGRAIEIVRGASARARIALDLVPVGLGAPGSVVKLRLDGFACMAITPGRTDFTFSIPYLTTEAALFFAQRTVGREEQEGQEAPAAGGITVATPRAGPLFDLLSERVTARRPALDDTPVAVARVVPGTDYGDCLQRVLRGEVDAAALNAEVGRAMVARLFPGAFVDLPAPLPDLGLAVALTGEPQDAKLVLSRLDPALESVVREARTPVRAPGGPR
jgi:ABC-type amino acid transport substrate-binding protein